ncbi:MAG: hypothetical protein Q4G63_09200 [Bacteroidia bacterium]|nr:hypothetical protein [Bacteroidia bacterium]
MKKNIFVVLTIMLLAVSLFSSFEVLSTNTINNRQRDKIVLQKIGGTTRSTSDIIIDTSTDTRTNVTVSVMDFSGTAIVQIIGGRTSAQYYFDINEMGYEIINISTLRAGTYTIRVILNNEVYEGTFVKVLVGR